METSCFRWNYFPSLREGPLRTRAAKFIENTEWASLLQYATQTRNGAACTLLSPIGLGHNHMVRIIEFNDGVRWVARLRLPPLDGEPYSLHTSAAMESEVCTISLVLRSTDVPVPRIHAYETSPTSGVEAPFMLQDCLEGNVGMDLGMVVPSEHKASFFRKVAEIHVALSGIRLPKIGTILSVRDGNTFEQGPIPGIGGPFDTATEFFKAWAATVQFPVPEERLRAASGTFADEIVLAVSTFANSINQLASTLSTFDKGPFPLCHGDFGHNNIIVDNDYQILGVIDWESAYASPWELAGSLPLTLSTIPPALDAPWNYDEHGNPKDPELAAKLADQRYYIEAVKDEEKKHHSSYGACLSKVMEDYERQHVITSMRLFEGGKSGFYSKVVDQMMSR